MWHASTCAQGPGVHRGHLVAAAYRILAGSGAADLGEWPRWGETPGGSPVYHLRRRLTAAERALLPDRGAVRDVRGSTEEVARLATVAAEAGIDIDTLRRLG
ncbi:MAG: hypothetical protein F4Y94_08615 [Chloroflexi bacterium]|nr:hypothetical protein [Chloroflexota bacterium]